MVLVISGVFLHKNCEASGGGISYSEYQPYGHNMDNEQLNYIGYQQPPYQQEKKLNLEEMLSKFISVSKTHFQNTETALKNQQALIQRLQTQIGQLSKLISERPQGSLPSNTEPNPREQLNAINIQDEEGVVESEPEPRQETMVSKGQGEVNSHSVWETKQSPFKLAILATHRELKNELNTFPNQLKIGDRVLLDAADPHIVATTPNEEIPLTVLSIFPFGTVEVRHPKFDTLKVNNTRLKPYFDEIDDRNEEVLMSSSRGNKIVVPAWKKRKGASSSVGPTTEIRHPLL
ncbi:hypothetical protein GOBAR_AA14373 [Gossypium barbadense]|uniref:Uncharacterized protein n=1 Tax=Gossypium barbadense TaxID=3634 RepID=A0A2P5XSF4_GOSBA|nr:hypothetical protein GOBAR_AA14373 [Gossypium barbadense]